MEITVRGDRLFFKQEHVDQVAKLITKHLSALPSQLLTIQKSGAANPLPGCSWLNFNFRFNEVPHKPQWGAEYQLGEFWREVGPFLAQPVKLCLKNENGESFTYFTGSTPEVVDQLRMRTLASILRHEVGECFPAATVEGEAQLMKLSNMALRLDNWKATTPSEMAVNSYTSYAVYILATNSEGVPEMLVTDVMATGDEYQNGEHYAVAERRARSEGYTLATSFDENDKAARAISRENCYTLNADDEQPADNTAPSP